MPKTPRLLLLAMLTLLTATAASRAQTDPLATAIAAAQDPHADLIVVFDRTTSEVEESGLSHVVSHRLTKVLTADGARELRSQRFDYDPTSQLIEVRQARVHRHDGSIEDLDLASVVDTTQPMHAIYWGARMLVLPVPRLEVGDALEVETYRKGFMIAYLGGAEDPDEDRYIPPMRGHWYDVQVFAERYPMVEKTVTVRLPLDKRLQYRT
ncbi:MAG: DUF3857 domain-containing protein, partial [Candidatus Krumholzibacteriia bacterium]